MAGSAQLHTRLIKVDRFSRSALLWILLVAVAYIGAAQIGFMLAFATKQVTAVWPPTGIAVAALIIGGPQLWPGVFAGALISNAMSNETLLTATGIAVGNTAGPLAAAYMLRHYVALDASFSRVHDVLSLAFLGAALAMMITSTNGVINLALGGIIEWQAAASVWFVWWVGDAMGVLLVAPVILTWSADRTTAWPSSKRIELAACIVATAAITKLSFSSSLPLAYPVFPAVIWAALRFSQRECACIILLVSAIAIWHTVNDFGPFVVGSFDLRLVMLVTFLAVLSITGLSLGALSTERLRAESALRNANSELEERVIERTAALACANKTLSATNAKLENRTAELARKNEEVEAFVYIVSHDLRAPLVNLQGFSRELELSCDDLEKKIQTSSVPADVAQSMTSIMREGIGGALRYIGTSVSKFERLINALLVLSRTGQQNYNLETVDAADVVRSTIDSLRQTIDATGAQITIHDLPKANGDVTAVGQVFANLIGNALKYLQPGRRGDIHIAGRSDGANVEYCVRDNGAGIPDRAKARVFQVFQRFHPELAGGEGIGLAAIKRIVERHGGKIWMESQSGAGSSFYFTLPAARDQ